MERVWRACALTGFRDVSCFQEQTPSIEGIANLATSMLRAVPHSRRRRVINRASSRLVVAALILGAKFIAPAGAQSGGGQYRIDPVALSSGGGPIVGDNYQITSTLALTAAGTLAGAGHAIFGGFWSPAGGFAADSIFANGFELD